MIFEHDAIFISDEKFFQRPDDNDAECMRVSATIRVYSIGIVDNLQHFFFYKHLDVTRTLRDGTGTEIRLIFAS